MRRFLKWFAAGLGLLLAGGIVIGTVLYTALSSTVTPDNGAATIPGLGGEATVMRDRYGIPHISARTYADAVRALGYTHAQDRFWQMHVLRMVAQGRLSEMFGEPTLDSDIFLRTVDIAGASKASFGILPPRARLVLEAYAAGVNAWLDRKTGLFETVLPPEFLILGQPAERWEPWQSVAMLKVMALTLDSNLDDEIGRLALAGRGFSNREMADLIPYNPRDNPPPMPELREFYGFGDRGRTAGNGGAPRTVSAAGLAWETGVTASNNWVVAGSRTRSGKPLLANDPHLGLTAPAVFHLAHLEFEVDDIRHHVIGGTLPGTPLVLVGRTSQIAWGLTTTTLDSQDLFLERVDPRDPGQYETPQGPARFTISTAEIKVAGRSDPHRVEIRATRHGPVLPMAYRDLQALLPEGQVAALQWASLARDDTTMEAAIRLNLSRSVEEALDATRLMVAPMQSIVAADVAGRIALVSPGRVPVRSEANAIRGRAPVPGWLAEYDWTGFLDPQAVPRIVDPANGALATANSRWLPADYGQHITFDWDEPFRQERVEKLVIEATGPHDPDRMKAIQLDNLSPALVRFRDVALAQVEAGQGQEPGMADALRRWNGLMDPDRPEPLILTAWWRHTERQLFLDDLGEDFVRFDQGHLTPVLAALSTSAARDWCDDVATARIESCGAMLARALRLALEELTTLQGDDWRTWKWGEAHLAFGEHRPFSSVGLLSRFFTIARPSAGDSYTLLRGRTDFGSTQPYRSVHASAYRGLYDLADPERSLFIISSGQSGHFLSRHYDDLADRWASLDYVPMTTDRQVYSVGASGLWTFTPQ